MILRPDLHRRSGPVTDAERLARIGHRPYVIRLIHADRETAQLVERHLFDIGHLVHVSTATESLAEVVRTGFYAGLVTIVFGPAAEQASALPDGIPRDQVVTLDRAQFEQDTDLAETAAAAIARGNPGNVQLTDGGGI